MDMCYLACVYRTPSGYCGSTEGAATCPHRQRKLTNADRIRSMTDEELANKMSGLESFALTCGGGWPPEKWLEWLKEEVKDV